MSINPKNSFNGKMALFIIIAVFFFAFFGMMDVFHVNLMEQMGIPVIKLCFADLRVLTSGCDALRAGDDPLLLNPLDPWKRPTNYPRIWLVLAALGVHQTHTILIGVLLVVCFYVSIFKIIPSINGFLDLLIYSLIILSPACMLAVERGNVDMAVFIILSFALFIPERNKLFFYFSLLLASLLKFFPVFAFLAAFKESPKTFIKVGVVCSSLFLCYLLFTWKDFLMIDKATPRMMYSSYGNLVLMCICSRLIFSTRLWRWGGFLLTALVSLGAYSLARFKGKDMRPSLSHITSFRIGAGIYVGTFLLGNNFVYRLIFLIFTIPQFLDWARNADGELKQLAQVSLLLMIIIFWSLLWTQYVPFLNWGGISVLEEVFTWSLFAILIAVSFSSLPHWAKRGLKLS
ncbi:MAG: hypothetical protein HQL24_00835 [Candidatus Omnitrophica bacterium]|nr:hypothetical protein [Candidatus Omnitrophota bacterium]